MAENLDDSLEDLEKEITCLLCHDKYIQPKLLPCLHYFCKLCILKLANNNGIDKSFSCPVCSHEATLPEGNEENFQTAFFIHPLKDLYTIRKRALGNEVKCDICTHSPTKAEAFCQQCDKFVCRECIRSHQRMKVIFEDHKIIALNEMVKAKPRDLLTKDNLSKKCTLHQKCLEIFCFDCKQLICRDCIIREHKDHDVEFNRIAAAQKKEELTDYLKPLKGVLVNLSHVAKEIQTRENELQAQGLSVANTITASFKGLHEIMDKCEKQLLEETKTKVSKKIKNLKGQEKHVSAAGAEISRVMCLIEKCVSHCHDDELLSMHVEVISGIEKALEEHGGAVAPVESVDVGVEVMCAESLEQLCQSETKLTQLPVNLVVNKVSSEAEVNKISEISLCTTNYCNNRLTVRDVKMDHQIKSLYSGSLINSHIDALGGGTYRILYTPTVRGRYSLTISVNGQEVAGSPFPLFVSFSSTQYGKVVKYWGGIRQPTGISVNSVGQIIVTEFKGDVVVLDKDGVRLRTIKCSEHRFQSLHGVAVDSDDNIYLVDIETDQVFKSHPNCIRVEVYKVKQVAGPGHVDVAVVGHEVMVTECGNDGRIRVYDRELKYAREIFGEKKGMFAALFPDSHRNVYVSVPESSHIEVFSNNGEFLRLFSCDESGMKRLKYPCGICVSGKHVFVADKGLGTIVMFTTDGNYLTSFGYSNCYSKLCVDCDGFVYTWYSMLYKLMYIF